MEFNKAVSYMEDASARGSILGLVRIRKLCEILGNPQDSFEIIHIAGTNGKGSTSAFIASVLKEAGYRTGMYYSPALCGITDHYMVDGVLISDEEYAECVEELAGANDSLHNIVGEYATVFELETALAFLYFRKKGCSIAVVETGLGGRDDATNVITNEKLCVFSSISFDHMAILGNTIYDIASVKAGIITSPCPVVAFESSKDAINAISERCEMYKNDFSIVKKDDIVADCVGDRLYISYKNHQNIEISLLGEFQKYNASLALEAIDALNKKGMAVSDDAIRRGMKNAYWPFRYERININPCVILDGAHNRDAADKLADTIKEQLSDKDIILVIGMFKDKDYDYVIGRIAPLGYCIYTLSVPDKNRVLPAAQIAEVAIKHNDRVTVCESIWEAACESLKRAEEMKEEGRKPCILAFGSLSYLSEFKKGVIYHGQDK